MRFDLSQYPFCTIDVAYTPRSLHSWESLMRQFYEAVGKEWGLFGVVMHVHSGAEIDARMRQVAADILKENEALLYDRCVAWGQVLHDPVQLGIFRALTWMAPPQYKLQAFTELGAAVEWVSGEMKRSGCSWIH